MSQKLPDYPLVTVFPDGPEPQLVFEDVGITTFDAMQEYYKLFNQKKFNEANLLLTNNPALKKTIINAKHLNTAFQLIYATQEFYLSDFQEYIINAIQFKGTWSSTVKYEKFNVVYYSVTGLTYLAISNNIPIATPPTSTSHFIQWAIQPGSKIHQGIIIPATSLGVTGDWYFNTSSWDIYEKIPGNIWMLRGNIRGLDGLDGSKIFQGTSAPPPITLGNVGDWYINTTTWNMYEKTPPNVWTLRGNISGSTIHQGTLNIPPSTLGKIGDWYINTSTWDIHEKTATNMWIHRGNIKGDDGSVIRQGSVPPINTDGKITDWYINISTWDMYEKTPNNEWTLRGNIKGIKGDDGSKIIQGTTTPSNLVGVINDWYFNINTWDIYEKTDTHEWTWRGNIRGTKWVQMHNDNIVTQQENYFFIAARGIKAGDLIINSHSDSYSIGYPTQTVLIPGDVRRVSKIEFSSGTVYGTILETEDFGNIRGLRGSIIHRGTTSPPSSTLGAINDWYLDTVTWEMYEKINSTSWVWRGNINGTQIFPVTNNITVAPTFSRVNDLILNSGATPITIANVLNVPIGGLVLITQRTPLFQGVIIGNIRGKDGRDNVVTIGSQFAGHNLNDVDYMYNGTNLNLIFSQALTKSINSGGKDIVFLSNISSSGIMTQPYTLTGNLNINRPGITIKGNYGAVIDTDNYTLQITGDNVRFEGDLEIIGLGTNDWSSSPGGVVFCDSKYASFNNIKIVATGSSCVAFKTGIHSEYVQVNNCDIVGSPNTNSDAIMDYSKLLNSYIGNRIHTFRYGINLYADVLSQTNIRDNVFYTLNQEVTEAAIYLQYGGKLNIENNRIKEIADAGRFKYGILSPSSIYDSKIINNYLYNCYYFGIEFKGGYSEISGNHMTECNGGIYVSNSVGLTVQNNFIRTSVPYGIFEAIAIGNSSNSIVSNNIIPDGNVFEYGGTNNTVENNKS